MRQPIGRKNSITVRRRSRRLDEFLYEAAQNFEVFSNIQDQNLKIKNLQWLMSLSRPIQRCHSHVDLIWLDDTFKQVSYSMPNPVIVLFYRILLYYLPFLLFSVSSILHIALHFPSYSFHLFIDFSTSFFISPKSFSMSLFNCSALCCVLSILSLNCLFS